MRVSLRVKELATSKGFNMSQLQRQTGLSTGMVRRYWHNKTRSVSLEALGKMAELLQVRPGDLLSDERDAAENSEG